MYNMAYMYMYMYMAYMYMYMYMAYIYMYMYMYMAHLQGGGCLYIRIYLLHNCTTVSLHVPLQSGWCVHTHPSLYGMSATQLYYCTYRHMYPSLSVCYTTVLRYRHHCSLVGAYQCAHVSHLGPELAH